MKSTVNSTLSRQNQKPHEKYLVLKKEEEIKHFYLACGNYREKQEHFNFRIPLFVKFVKQHPLRKVKVIKVLKVEKRGKEMLKVQDVHSRTWLPQVKNY